MKRRQTLKPRVLVVEKDVLNTTRCKNIMAHFENSRVKVVENAENEPGIISQDDVLFLARQRGPFLRMCPGTKRHICCLYYNLDIAQGCNLQCSYCILQGYINSPHITLYCNMNDMYRELDETLNTTDRFFRIGTGELSDSLTFDAFTAYGSALVSYFADKSNAIIELKTKSCEIDDILNLRHNRRTVVSWSLNSERIASHEEPVAPAITERIAAAKKVQTCGYRLGFHFDPMIYYDGWEKGYKKVVDRLFGSIKPENIAWISLGALRYPASFDEIIRNNFPHTDIVRGELLPGIDLKKRYFQPIRVMMYSRMYQWIKSHSQDVLVYLCMESDSVWRQSFGWSPGSNPALARLLDDRVRDKSD